MTRPASRVIFCNGAAVPSGVKTASRRALRLEYRDRCDPNVRISLPDFVRDVYHLPERVLDLLEIASYVFAADRMLSRGRRAALEYDSWSRSLHFVIKVRDVNFWSSGRVQERLSDALCFLTGDRRYAFSFEGGHSTPPTSLFDSKSFRLPERGTAIVLFSGGLDSLTGALDQLAQGAGGRVCMVSHLSQAGTTLTQRQLAQALDSLFPGRTARYEFECVLHGQTPVEETQRTRVFLYVSIAYALARALSQSEIFIYENGLTALNFSRREDLLKARASRTTHPKTIRLLAEFLSELSGQSFTIHSPYCWMTKADVLRRLTEVKQERLITSAVSCSRTFQKMGRQATHCGVCSQCIERRFAAYATELDDIDDSGLYGLDFVKEPVQGEAKTALVDFVRQARGFADSSIDQFCSERGAELIDAFDGLPDMSQQEAVEKIWKLSRRHGEQVLRAIRRMREINDHPYVCIPQGSFLNMISEREYLKEPVERLVEAISQKLKISLPLAFQRNLPIDEHDFNDKLSAVMASEKQRLEREHPAVRFALAHAVPDHSWGDVFIESKYIRKKTTPAKVNEGMAADLKKYGKAHHILFVVYDPERSISDDLRFKADFENGGSCTVLIIR